MGKRIPVQVRFFAKIADAGDCWVWTAELDRDGYGHFRDEHGRRVRAHRWAFEFFMALIPSGLVIDHLCRRAHRARKRAGIAPV